MAAMPPVNRSMGQTPPIVHSHLPPVQRMHTPQEAPSTPSAHSQTQYSASTPPTNTTVDTPPSIVESKPVQVAPPTPVQPTASKPFYPPLPWLSAPGPFPPRAAGRRRRRRAPVAAEEEGLALPSRDQAVEEDAAQDTETVEDGEQTPTEELEESLASTAAVPSDTEVDTPSTSHPPSEVDLAHIATPPVMPTPAQPTATTNKHTRTATIPAVPLIPFKSTKPPSATSTTQKSVRSPSAAKLEDGAVADTESSADAEETPKGSPPKPAPPKSWAELLRAKNAPAVAPSPATPHGNSNGNGNGVVAAETPIVPRSNTLADVLASFAVESEKKVSFLEPRGLVNTGNLCYMNSVSFTNSCQTDSAKLYRFFKFFFSAFLSTTF
jgi:ubiquitin carboxyl-terminal hydrolase 10